MERSDAKRLDRRQDGFGTRWFDPKGGRIEVLDVSPVLSTPENEQIIRNRMTEVAGHGLPALAPVRRVERNAQTLSVVTATPAGVPLAELLAAAEFGLVDLSDDAAFAVARSLVARVGALHALPGAPMHGALTAAHVIVQRDGTVVLTGWTFANALSSLERSRTQFWNEFGLVMPPSNQVDQQSDVAQLGFLVLALLLRRVPCGRGVEVSLADLVEGASAGEVAVASTDEALRAWLSSALHLGGPPFANAAEAGLVFAGISVDVERDGSARPSLDVVVRQMCGELPLPPIVAGGAEARALAAAG